MKLQVILAGKSVDVHTIAPDQTLIEVIDRLVEHNCGSLLVCQDGKMVGIITERDILRACAQRQDLTQVTVSEKMSSPVITAGPGDEIGAAMGQMTKNRIRHLPITDAKGNLIGMISIGDVVKFQHDQLSVENQYLKNYIQS